MEVRGSVLQQVPTADNVIELQALRSRNLFCDREGVKDAREILNQRLDLRSTRHPPALGQVLKIESGNITQQRDTLSISGSA